MKTKSFRNYEKGQGQALFVLLVAVLIVAAAGVALTLKRCKPGEYCVVVHYTISDADGYALVEEKPVAQFFWINPINQKVARYPAQEQTTSLVAIVDDATNEVIGGDAVKCSDSGGASVWVNVDIWWQVVKPEVGDLYLKRPGYALDSKEGSDGIEADDGDIESELVLPAIRDAFARNCDDYSIVEMYASKRGEFFAEVEEQLRINLASTHLILTGASFGNINSTAAIEASLQKVATAEQAALEAEHAANAVRTEAQGAADAAVLHAQGQADAAIIAAQAEAEKLRIEAEGQEQAIAIIGEAVTEYGMTLKDYKWLETWDGRTPTTLVVSDDSGEVFMTIDLVPTEGPGQ